ncbi:hypothetical protein BFP70_03615 [Thioclava sp. SK-1]|uniref:DUF167 domain-containing protein n=1 Tax=Thioclava sp. SK-1 TaxID=1889770 RepID=UPI000826FA4A|nr:hypothetical protein BFP70_03615 [Thioclava sp. SK-1]
MAPGQMISVRVTPKASRNVILYSEDGLRAYVTTVPENGKATAAVQTLLARWLGVPKSRLVLARGATHRDKVFRLE